MKKPSASYRVLLLSSSHISPRLPTSKGRGPTGSHAWSGHQPKPFQPQPAGYQFSSYVAQTQKPGTHIDPPAGAGNTKSIPKTIFQGLTRSLTVYIQCDRSVCARFLQKPVHHGPQETKGHSPPDGSKSFTPSFRLE